MSYYLLNKNKEYTLCIFNDGFTVDVILLEDFQY